VKATKFKSLKERLAFLLHVLKERRYVPGSIKRTELVQALLSADNIHVAQEILLKHDKSKGAPKASWLPWPPFPKFPYLFTWSKRTDESLPKEATQIRSVISDSDFLHELKGIQDTDLAVPIHEAFVLVYSHLSSLINATVNKVTHAVLRMQQDKCRKIVEREIMEEKGGALDRIMANFIRDVNRNSTGRRTSCVLTFSFKTDY
jgi:hypothetical protein